MAKAFNSLVTPQTHPDPTILCTLDVSEALEDLQGEWSARDPRESWVALGRGPKGEHFVVEVDVGGRKCGAFVDIGSTRNFISHDCVDRLGLKDRVQRLSRPVASTLANKELMMLEDYVKDVVRTFSYPGGELNHKISFLVSDELPFDMLLRMYYLEVAKPQFDWDKVLKHELPSGRTVRLAKYKASRLVDSYGCLCASSFYNYYKQNPEEGMYLVYVSAKGEAVKTPPEIENIVAKYPDLFKEPTGVVDREIVHAIEIIPGSKTPKGRIYRMAPAELDELRRQLKELTEKGWIRPSTSPYGSPVLFFPKKRGTLRMCIDYGGLNAITVKNAEPLPRIDDLLDRVQGLLAQQEGKKLRPIEYMSKKMPSKKLAKSTYERELYALYKALVHWRHYLLGRFFYLRTDHQTLEWIKTQPVLSDALKRWIEVLDQYDFKLDYLKGEYNKVVDALSRRADYLGALISEFGLSEEVTRSLDEAYKEDPITMDIINKLQAKDKATTDEFVMVDGSLFLEKAGFKRLVVPSGETLRSLFLGECHDATGHFGYKKTSANLVQRFWWPNMLDDVKKYVETCQVCQRDKPRTHAPLGLIKPLHIPAGPRQSISMDFMDTLATSKNGKTHIFVIVDRFTKYARLIAMPETARIEHVIKLDKWVRDFGLPKTIVSDRDVKFTSEMWKKAAEQMGNQLQMTSGNHPEANGQAEQMNRVVQHLLRHYIKPNQDDWDEKLPLVVSLYNNVVHNTIGASPNQLHLGWKPRSALDFLLPENRIAATHGTIEFGVQYEKLLQQTVKHIKKSQEVMIVSENKRRGQSTFQVGERVWVKASELGQEFNISRKLMPQYFGPWEVLDIVGKDLDGRSYIIRTIAVVVWTDGMSIRASVMSSNPYRSKEAGSVNSVDASVVVWLGVEGSVVVWEGSEEVVFCGAVVVVGVEEGDGDEGGEVIADVVERLVLSLFVVFDVVEGPAQTTNRKDRKQSCEKELCEPMKMSPEIEGVVAKYPDLFEEPTGVVDREVVHAIEIIPGSSTSKGRIYRMSPDELDELRRQLKELVEKGWIRLSVSPYRSPILFVPKKKEGALRMCIDYRGLNAITVKNREPLPRIDDLFDKVQGCRYFSKIDLKSGYHRIAIRHEDQHKIAFQPRYGLYEFVMMPFGLCNARGTFRHAMNRIFHDYLDNFVIAYLDDILIFSRTIEEHVAHLDKVRSLLRQHKFKINGEKCEFGRTRILHLGHEISVEGLKPDDAKLAGIRDWPRPQSVTKMRSFLGMAGYYRTFVKNYSIVAAPLTDLTRLDTPWEWTDKCEAAFRHLKHALTHYEVLKLPDPDKPFVVTTDASQYGIGVVLAQQEGLKLRPVKYMSKKTLSHKLAKSTYEKELYAVYKALTH
ncbi:hypothetical protein CBR_g48634 [Chara braunii]|uniref:RNA-directed DNA polymerase n=1 Tax=Chara braunii TaxID=69332 RepID=A0A388M3F7_CHABU|nr:hypothetical protein CBR_g48634 [Chara braunii]|eukprot:GBG89025.1 hypothetical protein CBR_g48634 [Chara braunii]